MVVSSRGGGLADTRATAPPLIYPTTPSRLVALLSRWGSLGRKIWEILWGGLDIGWLLWSQLSKIKPRLGSSASRLASRSGECHNSHRHKTALAHQRAFRCWGCGGDSRGRRGRLVNTPPFPQSRPTAARQWVGVSPAGSRSARGQPARRVGRRRLEGGAE